MESVKIRNKQTNEFVEFGVVEQPIRNWNVVPDYENQTYKVPNTDGRKFLQKLLSIQTISFESNVYIIDETEVNEKIQELISQGQTEIQARANAPQIILYEKYDALLKILSKESLLDITATRYDGQSFTMEGVSLTDYNQGTAFRS